MQPQDNEEQQCYSNKQAQMSKTSSLNLWTLEKQTITSAAVTALGKWIFSSQSQLIFCPSEIWPTPTKARWDIFAVCIELKKKKKGKYCNFGADFNNQIRDLVLHKCRSDYVNHELFEER